MQEYKTSWREKICFGVGAIGLDLSYGMFYSFLSYYLSSVLGLKEAFLLLLTPIARIWDGINDPMMGTIVDKARQIQALDTYRRYMQRSSSFLTVHKLRHERNKALHIHRCYVYPLGYDKHNGGYSVLEHGAVLYV